MRALSIRQPYAELILRGKKRIEYRTMTARNLIGQRFYIYAARSKLPVASEQRAENAAKKIWSDDLAVTTARHGQHPPTWLLELAQLLITGELRTGVIVGSAIVEKVTRGDEFYEWHLTGVRRLVRPLKITGQAQPVWFKPF